VPQFCEFFVGIINLLEDEKEKSKSSLDESPKISTNEMDDIVDYKIEDRE
jgi:hypothetical protein